MSQQSKHNHIHLIKTRELKDHSRPYPSLKDPQHLKYMLLKWLIELKNLTDKKTISTAAKESHNNRSIDLAITIEAQVHPPIVTREDQRLMSLPLDQLLLKDQRLLTDQ